MAGYQPMKSSRQSMWFWDIAFMSDYMGPTAIWQGRILIRSLSTREHREPETLFHPL